MYPLPSHSASYPATIKTENETFEVVRQHFLENYSPFYSQFLGGIRCRNSWMRLCSAQTSVNELRSKIENEDDDENEHDWGGDGPEEYR